MIEGTMQLRRLFRIVNGGTPGPEPENWGGQVAWVTPDDLGKRNQMRITGSTRTLTEQGLEAAANLVPRGSIVLSTRAPIGHLAIASRPLAFNQGCKALVPRQELDERFFYYQLVARRPELEVVGQGATFAELSATSLGSIRVACPPLDEQRRVGDFLSDAALEADAVLDRAGRLVSLMTERLSAFRERVLTGPAPRARLKWYTRSIAQGESPQAEDRPAGPEEWGVLKLSAVHSGSFRPQEHKALPVAPGRTGLLPEEGDLLVTRANTPELVGDCCVVDKAERRLFLPDLIYRVRVDPVHLLPRYVMHFLLSPMGRFALEAAARGTSQSMVKLRGADIANVELPVPPVAEQMEIVRRLEAQQEAMDAIVRKVAALKQRVRERRTALITAAVTDQLDATSYRASALTT